MSSAFSGSAGPFHSVSSIFSMVPLRSDSIGARSIESESSYLSQDDRLIMDGFKSSASISPMMDEGFTNLKPFERLPGPSPVNFSSDLVADKTVAPMPVKASAFAKPVALKQVNSTVPIPVNRALFQEMNVKAASPAIPRSRSAWNVANSDMNVCVASPSFSLPKINENEISSAMDFQLRQNYSSSYSSISPHLKSPYGFSGFSPSGVFSQLSLASPSMNSCNAHRASSPIKTERLASHKFFSPYSAAPPRLTSPLTIGYRSNLIRSFSEVPSTKNRSQSALTIPHISEEPDSDTVMSLPHDSSFLPIAPASPTRRVPILPFFIPEHSISRPVRAMRRASSESHEFFHPVVAKSSTVLNNFYDYKHKLPSKPHEKGMMISASVLSEILAGRYNHAYDRILLVDSRFIYEFEGGHINNAVHVVYPSQLYQYLSFEKSDQPPIEEMDDKTLIVYYCEYSSKRSPHQMNHMISMDRTRHYQKHQFNLVNYPEMYLLEGGYKNFVKEFPGLCTPEGGYVPEKNQQSGDFGEADVIDPNAELDRVLMAEHDRIWPWNRVKGESGRSTPMERPLSARPMSLPRSSLNLSSSDRATATSPFMRSLDDI